jgi:hypothetical protein
MPPAATLRIVNCFAMNWNPAWRMKSGVQPTAQCFGCQRFISQIETALGRRVTPGQSGRPRKMLAPETGNLF